jgi:hypothetical protein
LSLRAQIPRRNDVVDETTSDQTSGCASPNLTRPISGQSNSWWPGYERDRSSGPVASELKAPASVTTSLVCKALVGLLLFDLFGLGCNFSRLHRFVKTWRVHSRSAVNDQVARVCDAVNHACVWYPKKVLCLQRSAVTTCLLRASGVASVMVVGAQPTPFKAHAWTEVNGKPINERKDVKKIYGVWERF